MWVVNALLWMMLCNDAASAQAAMAGGWTMYALTPAGWTGGPFTPVATANKLPVGAAQRSPNGMVSRNR